MPANNGPLERDKTPRPDDLKFDAELVDFLKDLDALSIAVELDQKGLATSIPSLVPSAACFVLDENDTVLDGNHLSFSMLNLQIGQSVFEAGWRIKSGKAVEQDVPGFMDMGKMSVCSLIEISNSNIVDCICLEFRAKETEKLLRAFFVESTQQHNSLLSFGERYNLSPTELNVLQLFVSGSSLQDIADIRCRSLATVKTQFYKIMDKCDCKSQSELLKRAVSFDKLSQSIDPIVKQIRRPHQKRLKLMRPDGRTLEVTISGDPRGRVVLLCSSFFLSRFSAQMEEDFFNAGLCICAVEPPESGETSPPLPGTSLEQCFAEDMRSFLNSIECEKAVLWGAVINFPLSLRAANLLSDRICSVFSHCISTPPSMSDRLDRQSAWIPRMRKAILDRFGALNEVTCQLFFRYIRRIGAREYAKLIFAHDPKGREAFLADENIMCFEEALDNSMCQGMGLNTALLQMSFHDDWEADIRSSKVPIHFKIGEKDTSGPHAVVQELAAENPKHVTFETVAGESSAYYIVRPDELISGLLTAFRD